MYTVLLLLIYLAFISLGLPDSLLGSAWPSMHLALQVPLSYMGLVSMIISGGTISASLMSEGLTRRFGTRVVTVASVFLTATALFGFSTAQRFWQLCLWAVPYGLGAGAIDAALNNYVALHYSSRHMSWLHCFWGVGTIVSPYIMSYSLHTAGWQRGYIVISLLQFAIALVLLLTLPVWKINQAPAEGGNSGKALSVAGALRIRGVPSLLLGFFCYCAAESTAMLWASSYLVGMWNISEATAAAFASLFFIGITLGRFISGLVSERLGDRRLILLGTAIALAGVMCIALPVWNGNLALAGFVILGLGCAPVYPSIIHATPQNFGADHSQGIIGIQMASAYLGSLLMPPIFGLLASKLGLWLLPVYLLLLLVLMACMVDRTFRFSENQ